MPYIDVVILLVIFGFSLFGLWSGLIRTIGGLVGFFLGIYISSRVYDTFDVSITTKIIIFILIYTLVSQLVGLVFYFIEKAFALISIIPFTKMINRLLGGFLGFLEGVLLVGGAVFIVHYYNILGWVNPFAGSRFAPYLLKIIRIIYPIITDTIRKVIG